MDRVRVLVSRRRCPFRFALVKRWGREDPAAEVGALLSVIGAVLLAIATPAVSEDPVWQRVLYDVMLTGWRRPEQAVAIHRVAMDTVRTDVSHTIAR
ncbi:hypothetical protein ACWDUL_39320 [Nocardia niigatensis]